MLMDLCANAPCLSPDLSRCQRHDNHGNSSAGPSSPQDLEHPCSAATGTASSHPLRMAHVHPCSSHCINAWKNLSFLLGRPAPFHYGVLETERAGGQPRDQGFCCSRCPCGTQQPRVTPALDFIDTSKSSL